MIEKWQHAVTGDKLHPDDQRAVLACYVHRYTRDYVPRWARAPRPDGRAYPVQFASDRDWLAHTCFFVRRTDGRLDARYSRCVSSPTWPQ